MYNIWKIGTRRCWVTSGVTNIWNLCHTTSSSPWRPGYVTVHQSTQEVKPILNEALKSQEIKGDPRTTDGSTQRAWVQNQQREGERDAQPECSCALGKKTKGQRDAKSGSKPGGAKHVGMCSRWATLIGTNYIKCTFFNNTPCLQPPPHLQFASLFCCRVYWAKVCSVFLQDMLQAVRWMEQFLIHGACFPWLRLPQWNNNIIK